MAQDDTSGKLVWFFAGASIGAAIALLYAPKSGEETRRLLKDKALEGKDALAGSSRDIVDKSRELFEKGKGLADDAAEMFDRGRKLAQG
jgi:gas vesicle protein